MNPVQQLEAARALITPPENWRKGYFAGDKEGHDVGPNCVTAVCWCAVGALARVTGTHPWDEDPLTKRAEELLSLVLEKRWSNYVEANDSGGHEVILTIFDRAIERGRELGFDK